MFSSSGATTDILSRRAGRIAFGAVLILGMTWLVCDTIANGDGSDDGGPFNNDDVHPMHIGLKLAAAWALATAAYATVRLVVRAAAPVPRGDSLLRDSLVVPAVGIALVLPQTVHAVFLLPFGHVFDTWFQISLLSFGLPQLIFALTLGIHAAQLARGEPRMTIRRVFRWCVLASIAPCAVFTIFEPAAVIFIAAPALAAALVTTATGRLMRPVLRRCDALARRDRDALPLLPVARAL